MKARISFIKFLMPVILVLFLSGCTGNVVVDDFSMKKAAVYAIRDVKLSDFLGRHQLIVLDQRESLRESAFPRVFKRQGIFYVYANGRCTAYDSKGKQLNVLYLSALVPDGSYEILDLDIVLNESNDPECWLGIYDGNYKIIRLSATTGEIINTIETGVPFYSFRWADKGLLLLILEHQEYMVATCDLNGKIVEYGLLKKSKNATEPYDIYRDGDNLVVQYPKTSLAVTYQKRTGRLEECLLIKDDGNVNTWEKQSGITSKYGERAGLNAIPDAYNCILYLSRQATNTLLYFNDRNNQYLSLKKGRGEYKTVKVYPYNDCRFINDLPVDCSMDIISRYMAWSIEGHTDSDDSILFYILPETGDVEEGKEFSYQEHKLIIIDVLKEN